MAKRRDTLAAPAARGVTELGEAARGIKNTLNNAGLKDEEKQRSIASRVVKTAFGELAYAETEAGRHWDLASRYTPRLEVVVRELAARDCGLTAEELWRYVVKAVEVNGRKMPAELPEEGEHASTIPTARRRKEKPKGGADSVTDPFSAPIVITALTGAKLPMAAAVLASAREDALSQKAKTPTRRKQPGKETKPRVTAGTEATEASASPPPDAPTAEPPTLLKVPIADIRVEPGRRSLRDIDQLVGSIREVGLVQPILVTQDLTLVAGNHRLEACRKLGWTDIPAVVVTLDELHRRMAEIDENLVRNELTALERAESLKRRKAIYEALHPETRKGQTGHKFGHDAPLESETVSFSRDTAARTGRTTRTVEQEVQIARDLPQDVREAIRGTPMENRKRDLLELARLPADEQQAVAAFVKDGRATTFGSARRLVLDEDKVRAQDVARYKDEALAVLRRVVTTLSQPVWCALETSGGTPSWTADFSEISADREFVEGLRDEVLKVIEIATGVVGALDECTEITEKQQA